MTGLGAAHRGYMYQDLVTAYFMASGLVKCFQSITVDRKLYDNDRFDDLTVVETLDRTVRRQFKSSQNETRTLEVEDFTQDRIGLKIDHLIRVFKLAGTSPADEYRVCTTWLAPIDANTLSFLSEATGQVSFEGHPSKLFRLNVDAIWPAGAKPVWRALRTPDISRGDFAAFVDRFIIELECPQSSSDLAVPGQLEGLLLRLLTESVGVGRYPNEHRNALDVAGALIHFSTAARGNGQTLRPPEIEGHLRLRTDFGHVAQRFPVVSNVLVGRQQLESTLEEQVTLQQVVILTGGPGSGKSWTLTNLADHLRNEGFLVARHYCYLEPGDPDVQRRITTDVLFGNLMAELVDAEPLLAEAPSRPRYSAGPRELEAMLRHAVSLQNDRRVVLIVDGIDHISRVLSEARTLAAKDTDIIEELAALDIPDGVTLVVGSQPGDHLAPLLNPTAPLPMPDWSLDETTALGERIGVAEALHGIGYQDTQGFWTELHSRSEGNPLYAWYLCRSVMASIHTGSAQDPQEVLRDAPVITGDIATYYDYLYGTADSAAQLMADFLGVIDFGVTRAELQEIFPEIRHRVSRALTYLTPVLKDVTAQGGFRVYHESFRRYIVERARANDASIESILEPVIRWLSARGLFRDSKAYRFLLPCLRRAGRYQDILGLVGSTFISDSVAGGHPRRAIEANLVLAVDVAAETADWVALVRCAELHRSVHTCFEEKLLEPELYWAAFASVFGVPGLTERLLFDGQPTVSKSDGLILCSLADDGGESPPWEEYRALPGEVDAENASIAQFHGLLRVDGVDEACARVADWLQENRNPPAPYFRRILERLLQVSGPDSLVWLLEGLAPSVASGLIHLELARYFHAKGEAPGAGTHADRALEQLSSTEAIRQCLRYGASPEKEHQKCPELNSLDLGLGGYPEAGPVGDWVSGVAVAAVLDPNLLDGQRHRVQGSGWYRGWLRFVLALAQAEAKAQANADDIDASMVLALEDLASDTAPFRGKPRACDLYSLEPVIHDTIHRALSLLRTKETWAKALTLLEKISTETTTALQGTPNGPLTPEALVEILWQHDENEMVRDLLTKTIQNQVQRAEADAEFYEIQATQGMYLTQILAKAGRADDAARAWGAVALHLTAYGFRKDITIFDLLESIPALAKMDCRRAQDLLAQVQPLVDAVVAHTDGKETRHAHNAWFDALIEADPADALILLARSLSLRGGVMDWRLEQAVAKAIDATRATGSPLLLTSFDGSVPFEGREGEVDKRLHSVERLLGSDPSQGSPSLRRVAAQVQGDWEKFDTESYSQITAFGAAKGIPVPPADHVIGELHVRERPVPSRPSDARVRAVHAPSPIFPSGSNPLDVMVGLRNFKPSGFEAQDFYPRMVNAFGYRLLELLGQGRQDEAVRLIRFWAREHFFLSDASPLADLAEGLERHGYYDVAALTYTLAYARSRGGGGWLALGDQKHHHWLARAMALDGASAKETLAAEIAHILHKPGYVAGIAKHLTELCATWGDPDLAFAVWRASFEVVSHRLPGKTAPMPFLPYEPGEVRSVDVGQATLLLARINHPELGRKLAALGGVASAIQSLPDVMAEAIREPLRRDTSLTTCLLLLQELYLVEQAPYAITASITEELKALSASDVFGVSTLASLLLARIGIKAETKVTRPAANLRRLTRTKEQAVLSLDWNERVEAISSIWPSFGAAVAKRFDEIWEAAELNKRRCESRHKASVTPGRRIPPTQMLWWEQEIFEAAFHEILTTIRFILGKTRPWSADEMILNQVTPDLRTQVAWFNSRAVRPPLPLPERQTAGEADPAPLAEGGEFDGWYRCGYYEEQLLQEDENVLPNVVARATATMGWAFSEGPVDLQGRSPFGRGSADTWWEMASAQPHLQHPTGIQGPLVGMDPEPGLLGQGPVLLLPASFYSPLGLMPGPFPGSLQLLDHNGAPAVVSRTWSVRPFGNRLSEQTPRLAGCDLIMRADVYEKLVQVAGSRPLAVMAVARRDLNE